MNSQQQPTTDSGLTEYLEGYQQLELDGVEKNLRKTRNTILVVAALAAFGGMILYSMDRIMIEDLWFNFILMAAYIVLALLTKKMPMASVIIALILFVGTWILNIVLAGTEQIYQGILVKAAVIYYLIRGIGYAKEAEELRKNLNKIRN
ncbi:MAG TPA: hypothetical protein VEB42_07525 [Chitinophagaceae bacterium]|nr:hypothetical protein [Chitinophagaceae bacterium]